MGLEEYDFDDETPSGRAVEKGYYLVAKEDDARDYLDDHFGESLDEFSSSFGLEGIIDSNTVKSFAFAAKCKGYTDSKKAMDNGKLKDLEVDGAFAIQMTLDGNYAEEIFKTIEDGLGEYEISYEVFTQKELSYSKDSGHLSIHLDVEKTVDALLDNPNIEEAGKYILSNEFLKQVKKLTGDAAVSIEVNGADVLIVGGGSVNGEPGVLRDFVKAFGLAQDPLALPVNDKLVESIVSYLTDLSIMYLQSTQPVDPVPDTDPDTDPTGETTAETTAETTVVAASGKIGISFPTKDLQR